MNIIANKNLKLTACNERPSKWLNKSLNFTIIICIFFIFGSTYAQKSISTADTVQSLLKNLKNPDYSTSWEIVGALAKYPEHKSQIVPALIEALNYEWDNCSGDIRDAIAWTFIDFKAKEAVFPLLDLIKSGKSIEHECAECGCCFLALTPADELIERQLDPFCGFTVLKAVYDLADFSHSKAMADIVSEGEWKWAMLLTIGKVAPPRYAHFISQYKDDKDAGTRGAVAVALGMIDNDAITIPVLIQFLTKSDEEFYVRWEASNSMRKIGNRGKNLNLHQRLIDLLDNQDTLVVILAARTLGFLEEKIGLQMLYRAGDAADPFIRKEALMYLGEIADTGAKEIAIRKLSDNNLSVRACAIFALGEIGDSSLIPMLKDAFIDAEQYQKELEKKLSDGTPEEVLREQYGFRVFDLRETLQQAMDRLRKR
ncbi:MAG: HEAT repeat domain-containing protein [Bacteroidota bacterium]|nr:HEAT repeat domain-containing protein [Bacteroidota bacterium]